MKATIAVSGKGGVGKTTIAAMMIRELVARSAGAVLGVDADPNACLAMTLGVTSLGSVSELRDQTRNKQPSNTGIDRLSSFEYGLEQGISAENVALKQQKPIKRHLLESELRLKRMHEKALSLKRKGLEENR